jgi:hypothetical protein
MHHHVKCFIWENVRLRNMYRLLLLENIQRAYDWWKMMNEKIKHESLISMRWWCLFCSWPTHWVRYFIVLQVYVLTQLSTTDRLLHSDTFFSDFKSTNICPYSLIPSSHGSGIYVETLFWIVGLIPGWVKSKSKISYSCIS